MWAVGLNQGSHLWEQVRQVAEIERKRISSSQASSILHLNKYQSKRKLWRIIQGKEQRRNQFGPQIDYGNKWEKAGITFCKKLIPLEKIPPIWTRPGIVFDPSSPFCCSPDGLGFIEKGMGESMECFGLEVKCPYTRPIPFQRGEVDTAHLIQAFTCLMITRSKYWYLFYFNPYNRVKGSTLWKIYPNEELWEFMKKEAKKLIEEKDKEPEIKNRNNFIEVEKILGGLLVDKIHPAD